MRTTALRCLLRLYPREFRAHFGDEMGDYIAWRLAEARAAGRWRCLCVSARMAADLVIAAATVRAASVSAARVGLYCSAAACGLTAAVLSLSAALVAFDRVIRSPMIELTKAGGSGLAAAAGLALLTGAICALLRLYASLLQEPHQGRQSSR